MHDYKLLFTSETSKEEVMRQSFKYIAKTVPYELWNTTVEESLAANHPFSIYLDQFCANVLVKDEQDTTMLASYKTAAIVYNMMLDHQIDLADADKLLEITNMYYGYSRIGPNDKNMTEAFQIVVITRILYQSYLAFLDMFLVKQNGSVPIA